MITGKVNADYEPIICIAIHDAQGKVYEREAIVDTGFDGKYCYFYRWMKNT